jgi:hypothetical protein
VVVAGIVVVILRRIKFLMTPMMLRVLAIDRLLFRRACRGHLV